jgi:cation diffusion facilitator CzcD-associated flavoprotein CzcO
MTQDGSGVGESGESRGDADFRIDVADFHGDGYRGPAVLTVDGRSSGGAGGGGSGSGGSGGEYRIEVDLRGHFEPIDGLYHWYGRAAVDLPEDRNATGMLRLLIPVNQTSQVTGLTFGEESQRCTPCQIGDRDPWGRWRLSGTGTPPFPLAETPAEPVPALPAEVGVAIVGTGFGGIGAAIKLREAGFDDLLLLERAGSVGGTWQANTYPGCACDVPSNLYSFSFAPNPAWSRGYSSQPEIRAYLERVADRYALRPLIRFDTTVLEARWDPAARRWRLRTSRGELTARILIGATGPLADPSVPDIPGIADFSGPVLHTGAWDATCDLAGRRVAVVGTGASAIQLVPAIAGQVRELSLYQRTPAWVMARRDRAISPVERWLYRHVPGTQKLTRLGVYLSREATVGAFTKRPQLLRRAQKVALRNLARGVTDPELRAQLTPDYVMGCKRILLSNTYYPALARENVTVVDSGLARVDGNTLIASDGRAAEADVLVFATGFHATDLPVAEHIYSADGRSLAEVWAGDMSALRGTTVAGFPNLCFVIGPNTGLGHNSMVHIIESQLAYIVSYVKELRDLEARGRPPVLDTRPEAQRRWTGAVETRMRRTVWATGGCVSWYQNAAGRNPTLWPGSTVSFRRATRRIETAEYQNAEYAGAAQGTVGPQAVATLQATQQEVGR